MNSFGSMGIAYYEIEDYQGNKVKINPLNSDDINNFKKIAYDWIIKGGSSSPFALKLVGKDDNQAKTPTTYSKSNEVTSDLVTQWSKFVSTFKTNLRVELSNVILNVLKNNAIIKTEVYIKPYVLVQGDQSKIYDNIPVFDGTNGNSSVIYPDDPEDWRFLWHFGEDDNPQLSITTKALNYDDFNTLAHIYTNRDEFEQIYNIKWDKLPKKGGGTQGQDYEHADIIDNDNSRKFFDNINQATIKANMPKVNYNTGNKCHNVATILTESEELYASSGAEFTDNYMLTFGIRPYIDKSVKITYNNDTYDNFSKFISSLTDPNFKNQASNEYNSNLYNSIVSNAFKQALDQIKDGKHVDIYNLLKYYNNDSCINIIDKNVKWMTSSNKYTNNIFNYNVVNGLDTDDPNNKESNKKKTPQFSRDVYNKLCDRFGVRNDQYNDFNSAIDMHQLSYYNSHKSNNQCDQLHDYLGASSNGLIDNFISIYIDKLNLCFSNNSEQTQNTNDYGQIQDNFKYIITYNNMPVFEINKKCFDNNTYKNLINNLLNKSRFLNSSNNLQISQDEEKLISNLFTNISTNYVMNGIDTKSINYDNYYRIDMKQENITSNSNEIKVGNQQLTPTYNHLPTDNGEPQTMKRGIYDAVSLYNQNVQKLGYSSNNTNKDLISNYEPTDFLMLFKNAGTNNQVTPLELHYCETYSGVDNINLSLSNPNIESKLAFNYNGLNELKERLKVFNTPTKVYFIYHNDNLLIKDPIVYNASNPDFIDNPELVIQNALRKYGLAPETDHIMYNTDNGYVSLLNNVFVLYNFKLENREYYFDSFANAKDKLISYIKYNSYKI